MSKSEKRKNNLSYKKRLEISTVLLGISALLFIMSRYIGGICKLVL